MRSYRESIENQFITMKDTVFDEAKNDVEMLLELSENIESCKDVEELHHTNKVMIRGLKHLLEKLR